MIGWGTHGRVWATAWLLVAIGVAGCDDPSTSSGAAVDAPPADMRSADASPPRDAMPGRAADGGRDGIRDGMFDGMLDGTIDGMPDNTPDGMQNGMPDSHPDGMPHDIPIPSLDGMPSTDAAAPDAVPDGGPPCEAPAVWSRGRSRAGGVVVFAELLLDSPGQPDAEWIELYNASSLPVDLAGWRLDGAVRFTFPPEARMPPGARWLVARAPALLADLPATVFGPYAGRLDADGERLELYDRGGRRMDTVRWTAGDPWPVPADGRSLTKRDPVAESDLAEHWSLGAPGGTPGVAEPDADDRRPAREVLVPADHAWRFVAADPGAGWQAADFDDDGWTAGATPLFVGDPPPAAGTARFSADNHFALYVGGAGGEALRLLGRDAEGDWQSAEDFPFVASAGEHLYVAAWEAPGDSGSPQMVVGEYAIDGRPDRGTSIERFEAVLGPAGANPGGGLASVAPAPADLLPLIADGEWAAPTAQRALSEAPWNRALDGAFAVDAAYVWLDTFDPDSITNQSETFALLRTRAPLLGPAGLTALDAVHPALWLRATFDAGDPAEVRLLLDLLADDGAVVWLNGQEVHRQNVAPGPVNGATRAAAAIDPPGPTTVELATDALVAGPNVLAVLLVQAADDPRPDLRFAAELRAERPPPLPLAGPPAEPGAVVISEIMYHPPAPLDVAAPAPAEWIELHNRSPGPVDLTDWALVDGVGFGFPPGTSIPPGGALVVADDPAAFARDWPAVPVLGPWRGGLSNRGERLRLLDGCGAVVDDLRFFDGGRWPGEPDGSGPSLALRDVDADNGSPDAWSTSGEAGPWQVIEYRGEARPSAVGPDDQWHEFIVGLLDGGAVLLDDIQVVEDPDGAARLLVDEDFEAGLDRWRALGTHGAVEQVPDLDDPTNTVLWLRASGAAEHMHNHLETTLLDGAQVQDGLTYGIRLRARWLAGSNQLNTRLYFNRLPRTTRLTRPARFGTPGQPNGFADALGPTFVDAGHAPAVPAAGEPVRVAAVAHDPDGVERLTLWWALDGAPFAAVEMTPVGAGRFEGHVPGQPAGALIHVFVEAVDGGGAVGLWPAGGPAGRALVRVQDGAAAGAAAGLTTLRVLMTAEDVERLHRPTELMSNHRQTATVVVDESTVLYGVGVRAKGSQRGRPTDARFGLSLKFDPARPLRGVYPSVSLDRSEGTRFGQRELLVDAFSVAADLPSAEYNDPGYLIAPRPAHTGPVALQLARFGNLLLDNRFESGGDGMLFEYELVYFPTTTDDGTPTGRKRPQPDRVVGTPLRDLGEDPEQYRHVFQVKNNRERDDFGGVIPFAQVFGLPDAEFDGAVGAVIDVDQWLQAFAFSTLVGAVDHYAAGAQHNVQFYVRPADGRVLFFPHDLDFFRGDPRGAVVANRDLRRLIRDPARRRAFYRHLQRMIATVYNGDHLAPWADRLGELLPRQDFTGHLRFVAERARYVLEEAPDGVNGAVPPVPFAVESPLPGAAVPAGELVVDGSAWLDVRTIWVVGAPSTLAWIDASRWRLTVQVEPGDGPLRIEAIADDGARVGSVELPLRVMAP